LLTQGLVLKPHAFQLLLHFPLLLIQLVLSLLLLLELLCKLLLPQRLLVTAALTLGCARHRSAWISGFAVHRPGENAEAE
jgi:hypothetical protein